MKLSEVKNNLQNIEELLFQLPDGSLVPEHFHVTEIGKVEKNFIDCGGTIRKEEVVSFQLWSSIDYNHRLHPEKLINIIELSQNKLGIGDKEVEVEYQGETIQKFGLDFDGNRFHLTTKQTDCLAKDNCGIPVITTALPMANASSETSCTPGGGCC